MTPEAAMAVLEQHRGERLWGDAIDALAARVARTGGTLLAEVA